ncbi:MAG: ankyrin repeat domain-containing protein, partial [Myxococcota bacterium]
SWLRARRAGDPAADRRLRAALPEGPAPVGLRDVQRAIAREHGLAGWSALREALADLALLQRDPGELATEVLRSAWQGDPVAARRILARVPALARHSLPLAAMSGDLDEVRRRLARDPDDARVRGGPHDWEPLQYLAYGRLNDAAPHTVEIATLVLDAGGDPAAAFDDGWGNAYTLLNGVIGQGESGRPPHPRADALVALFVDRGAPAYDPQVLYDTSLHDDDTHWLDVMWARSDPDRWRADRMAKRPILDYLLGNAVERGHSRRVGWLLDHGADPNALHAYAHVPVQAQAQLLGRVELAALLEARGATPHRLVGVAAFQAAALRGDADEARRLAAADPSCLTTHAPWAVAAQRDLDDVAALLLALGLPVDLCPPDQKRALHWAAQCGAVRVGRRLIAAGADVDRRGGPYHGTPLGFALHFGQAAMVELLVPLRDVFGLAEAARLDRLAEVLREDPSRVHARAPSGNSALFALPDDEAAAVEVAELLRSHGADPRATNAAGETPAEAARRRGLLDAADALEA